MQNFNSVMAIISGLKSAPIERLKKSWNVSARLLRFSKQTNNQFFFFLFQKSLFQNVM